MPTPIRHPAEVVQRAAAVGTVVVAVTGRVRVEVVTGRGRLGGAGGGRGRFGAHPCNGWDTQHVQSSVHIDGVKNIKLLNQLVQTGRIHQRRQLSH